MVVSEKLFLQSLHKYFCLFASFLTPFLTIWIEPHNGQQLTLRSLLIILWLEFLAYTIFDMFFSNIDFNSTNLSAHSVFNNCSNYCFFMAHQVKNVLKQLAYVIIGRQTR